MSLLSVLLCTVTVHNKTDSREVYMTATQMEDTATYPSKIVMKQQGGKQHCTRNIPWRWSSIWPKHVGWHNRCRHSNVLKSDCVLMCILKHSAWIGFLNNAWMVRFVTWLHYPSKKNLPVYPEPVLDVVEKSILLCQEPNPYFQFIQQISWYR